MRFLLRCDHRGLITNAKYIPDGRAVGPDDIVCDFMPDVENSYVDLKNKQVIEIPPKPSRVHKFDYDKKEWILTLDDAKDAKWEEIKSMREAEEFGGFEWLGYVFDSDALSQQRISSAVQLATLDMEMSIEWTLADNSTKIFTAIEMIEIGKALANHVTGLHERGRILRSQVKSAENIAMVESISWQNKPTT